jgi:signal transduction histidine kinase
VLATGLAGSFVSIGLALLVAHWLTRRVRALEGRTRQIATGEFRAMPLPAWNDELRDLAASINAMANQLAQWQETVRKAERLRLLGQVSAGLVHQLRNGMTGARLAVQVHLRAGSAGEVDRQGLEVALRQLTLVDEKLQRFMHLGRDDNLSLQPCSLTQLVDEALTLLRPSYQHAHIDLRWQPPDPELMILGDVGRLGHLLLNVLGNAAEAAGPHGWVEVRARPCDEPDLKTSESDGTAAAPRHAVIEVIDSGPGPPATIAGRLFEEFVTSKPEGMGLGLAVAREVAVAHDGWIDWSRENGHTCFRIRFPLLESVTVRATAETAPTAN